MSTKELLDAAMKLKPEERLTLVEGLIQSLDEPDKQLDEIWAEESEKGLKAYRERKLKECRWRKYLRKNDARHFHQTCEAGIGRCCPVLRTRIFGAWTHSLRETLNAIWGEYLTISGDEGRKDNVLDGCQR